MNAQAALWNDLPRYLAAHVELSLVALVAGFAISLPLGVLASRRPGLGRGVLAIASVLQTIPGLALLALMVPLLGALGAFSEARGGPALSSIGFLPAVLALTLYSVLPMLRNVVTGLQGVDPAILEASRGVGMSRGRSCARSSCRWLCRRSWRVCGRRRSGSWGWRPSRRRSAERASAIRFLPVYRRGTYRRYWLAVRRRRCWRLPSMGSFDWPRSASNVGRGGALDWRGWGCC